MQKAEFYTAAQAAAKVGKHERTLLRWRRSGLGPPWIKVGRCLLYEVRRFWAWVDAQHRGGK